MKLYVGVSGGVDSMYLLTKLIDIGVKEEITCLNFNHDDDFSYKASLLVQDYCCLHNVKFIQGYVKNKFNGGNKEKYWREERYNFFKEVVEDNTLLLAHHKTDQYVSWVMSRLKMSNRCFIPIITSFGNMRVIRPLYYEDKTTIRTYIKEFNIPFLEDPTNSKGDRGRTELELLPVINNVISQAEGAFLNAYITYLNKDDLVLVSKFNKELLDHLLNVQALKLTGEL